jgi:hypothetical protein
LLAFGRSHGAGQIQRYYCCWWRQCLGLQMANAQECTHIVRARDVESVAFAEQDMFWKQSSREGVTEGLAGRRRRCMMVGDIVGKDRRKKRLSNQCPGSRPTVLQNALAIELSHVTSASYVPSALSSFAKRKPPSAAPRSGYVFRCRPRARCTCSL